jgi:hypothetical protein
MERTHWQVLLLETPVLWFVFRMPPRRPRGLGVENPQGTAWVLICGTPLRKELCGTYRSVMGLDLRWDRKELSGMYWVWELEFPTRAGKC